MKTEQRCEAGTTPATYAVVKRGGAWEAVEAEIIDEQPLSIFVNGRELATFMCTPCQQDALALGFLANEGVIASMDDVRGVHLCPSGACIDVWLRQADFEPPRRAILTSGCGGGVTFDDLSAAHEPIQSDVCATPDRLWALMDALYARAHLYSRSRGVHTSVLSDGERVLAAAEDVGRHNTLDKLRGLALLHSIDTRDALILTTGRISSEMINKARSMGVPIVCSRTSPTSLSARLANEWGMTMVGYLRRNSLNVYTHPERVVCPQGVESGTAKLPGSSQSELGVESGTAKLPGSSQSELGVESGTAKLPGSSQSELGVESGTAKLPGSSQSELGVEASGNGKQRRKRTPHV